MIGASGHALARLVFGLTDIANLFYLGKLKKNSIHLFI